MVVEFRWGEGSRIFFCWVLMLVVHVAQHWGKMVRRAIKGTAVCPFGRKASVLHDFLKLFPLTAPPNQSRVTSVMNKQHKKVQNISTQHHTSSFLFPEGDFFLQEKEHSYWRRRTASSQHPPRFACIYILSEYWIQMGNRPKNEVVIADHPICFLS